MRGVADQQHAAVPPAQALGQVTGVGDHQLLPGGRDDVRGRGLVRAHQGQQVLAQARGRGSGDLGTGELLGGHAEEPVGLPGGGHGVAHRGPAAADHLDPCGLVRRRGLGGVAVVDPLARVAGTARTGPHHGVQPVRADEQRAGGRAAVREARGDPVLVLADPGEPLAVPQVDAAAARLLAQRGAQLGTPQAAHGVRGVTHGRRGQLVAVLAGQPHRGEREADPVHRLGAVDLRERPGAVAGQGQERADVLVGHRLGLEHGDLGPGLVQGQCCGRTRDAATDDQHPGHAAPLGLIIVMPVGGAVCMLASAGPASSRPMVRAMSRSGRSVPARTMPIIAG